MKNICELLLLNGRHWYSTNEILKFYYWDKFLHFLSVDFLLGFFLRLYIFFRFWGNCPWGKLPPTPKLTLSQTLTLTGGQFSLEKVVRLFPNPKTNPDLDPNPNPNRWAIFLGGNCPDTIFLLRNLYIYARNIANIVDVWSSF